MNNHNFINIPNRQKFDEVRIITIPRFKESELSGDEWRISAEIQLFKKGVVIETRQFRDVETATIYVASFYRDACDGAYGETNKVDEWSCDQEGCPEKAIKRFKIKNSYCHRCGEKSKFYSGVNYLQFCEKHCDRGDGALLDNNDNLELIL